MNTDITLRVLDGSGNPIVNYTVPFTTGMSVKQVMETAFVLNQAAQPNADPFLYTTEYYGYSEDPKFPGYLGYEVEGIGTKSTGILPNSSQYYWELLIDQVSADHGAETTYPGPGSTVLWRYRKVPPSSESLTARSRVISARRADRLGAKR